MLYLMYDLEVPKQDAQYTDDTIWIRKVYRTNNPDYWKLMRRTVVDSPGMRLAQFTNHTIQV
jgi:hypothetical protein